MLFIIQLKLEIYFMYSLSNLSLLSVLNLYLFFVFYFVIYDSLLTIIHKIENQFKIVSHQNMEFQTSKSLIQNFTSQEKSS